MIFIRHAEPDKYGNLTEEGIEAASKLNIQRKGYIYCSSLPRSIETATMLFPKHPLHEDGDLNEWDKSTETADQFKIRVARALRNLPQDCIVIGHARFMTWAHWLLKHEVALGFDYLEGFEV